jgi:hypothetical protein
MGVQSWPDATLSICTRKNLLIKDLLFTRTQQNTTHQILNFTDRILSLEPSIHSITNSPTPTTRKPENRPAKQKQRSTNRKPIFFTLCARFWILLNLQNNLNRKILYISVGATIEHFTPFCHCERARAKIGALFPSKTKS